jgi:hypothetical protein
VTKEITEKHLERIGNYEAQEMREDGEIGVCGMTEDMADLYEDIMAVLRSERYKEIPADHVQIVFGRVYAIFVMTGLDQDGRLDIVKNSGDGSG